MIKKILTIFTITFLMTGCATQTFKVNSGAVSEPAQEKSHAFFIGGIGQQKTVDAASVCNGAENVIKVESEQTFINGLLGAITWGIYTPRTARVYCK